MSDPSRPPPTIVIELGVLPATPADPPAPRVGAAIARLLARLRFGPPPDRRSVAVTLAALVLATVAAATPARPPLVEVLTRGLTLGADFLVTPDRLYVTGDGPRGSALTAYGLPGGHRLWTVQPPPARGTSIVSVPGGRTLLIGATGRDGAAGGWSATTAVDTASGRVRWTQPGLIEPLTAGLGLTQPPGISVVDLATGRPLWTVYAPAAGLTPVPGRPGTGALIRPDGATELRDLRTGRVQRRLRLLAAGQQLVAPAHAGAGSLVLMYWGSTGSGLVAYDGASLVPRWRRPRMPGSDLAACGDLLCLRDGASMVALDPATGAARWSVRGRWSPTASGPVLWRTADDGRRGWLARPAPDGALHILDSFPYRLSECQHARSAIACRAAPGDVRVWSYRT